MDVKIILGMVFVLVALASCQSSSEPPATDNSAFVPGVFIAADALKNLQDKMKQPEASTEATQTEPPKVSKKSDQISDTSNQSNQGYPPNQQMPDQQQQGNPTMGNQQYYPPNQQLYSNQQMPNQPVYSNQPLLLNQQPGYNPQLGYQQGYQQQPGYQQNGMAVPIQPYITNPQAYIVAPPQPGYSNQQGILLNQQPAYQQPNQQFFIPNGQMTQPVGNPNLMGNANGAFLANPGQSQGNMYAIVPVNGQNMPNPNIGNNNNGYFVPVQQLPSNPVMLNNGK